MLKEGSKRYTVFFLFLLSMLNLLFMHYFFYFNDYLEWPWMYSIIINLCSVVFDASILLILFLLIFKGKFKPAILCSYILTLVWSFINVIYGRFFFQYMSLSAIGEVSGLGDGLVINSVMSAFHWHDMYYLLSVICFVLFYYKTGPSRLYKNGLLRMVALPVLSVLMTFLTYSAYHFVHPHYRNNWDLYIFRAKEFLFDSVSGGTPNLAHFQTGCIRVAIYELYDLFHDTTLTDEQRSQIETYYMDHTMRTTHHQRNPKIENVIIILLESFLSAPIDLKVEGKEITPFLNTLKNDSNVYYNGNMISDIGCGESGDGQFIYMTGILPMRYKMTVGQAKNNTLPALPKVFKEKLGIKHTEIIFPTMPNLWQQADMNVAYRIDNAYSLTDIVGYNSEKIDDSDIFSFAAKSLNNSKVPFFSLILSVSSHSPYNKFVGKNLRLSDKTLSDEYKNYLNTCHYTDSQINKYFNELKKKGIYDNTLIIIASDHYAHIDMLNMVGRISPHTPLFIVNGNISIEECWRGEFHQIDTYTTLMDILEIDQPWVGLGHTLLMTPYKNSVDATTSVVSEMIIEGDYFAQ